MKLIGVHMHIGSGIDYQHLERVYDAIVQQVITLVQDISAISAGGCRSLTSIKKKQLILNTILACGTAPASILLAYLGHLVHLEIEPGRFLMAESGCAR